jgi:hypothetical protein
MGHIVVIEHDQPFGRLFVALLTHAGHHATLVGSPGEFFSLGADPRRDLIIMSADDDWKEVQSRLPRLAPGASLLLLTGFIVGGMRPPGFLSPDYPGCHILPMPFGFEDLCRAVERSLKFRATGCPSGSN